MKGYGKMLLAIVTTVVSFLVYGTSGSSVIETPELRTEHVCSGDIDVRNAIVNLNHLENCTVIEGSLQITLLHFDDTQRSKFVFPLLREITGYLLVYRVDYLRSLELLFPNLVTIRGQTLFHNYALVLFEVPHLENIGLYSLTRIVRGGVRIEKNPKLCFINTIDWSQLSDVNEDHFVMGNKDAQDCVDMCPKPKGKCSVMFETIGEGSTPYEQPLCWNMRHCQIVCPKECSRRPCYVTHVVEGKNEYQCCHQECLGGCTGPLATDCVACKNIFHNGTCLQKCSRGLYSYRDRRCLTEEECRNLSRESYRTVYHKLLDNGAQGRQCATSCPLGYTESKGDRHRCSRCKGQCPKVCHGALVDNVAAAQKLKGCTVIRGILEIQIRGGDNIGAELEENLGMIEEVENHIKIVRSSTLVSLRFLKNLRIIRGTYLYHGKFALYVLDNLNLRELWDFDFNTQKLTIENGIVSFHINRRLCLDKIYSFINHIDFRNGSNIVDERHISNKTNGDLIGCNPLSVNLTVVRVLSNHAVIRWESYGSLGDIREYLSWTINYRETDDENISQYSERSACEADEWETKDGTMDSGPAAASTVNLENVTKHWVDLLFPLKPFTKYAVYVESYTITGSTSGAISSIVFFTTLPDNPSSVRDISSEAVHQRELHVSWKPPVAPNGIVTHYYIYWRAQSLDVAQFDFRDYCVYKLKLPNKSKSTTVVEGEKSSISKNESLPEGRGPDGTKCCVCPKSKEDLIAEDSERRYQIEFQNFLHDSMYRKRYVPEKSTNSSSRQKRSTIDLDDIILLREEKIDASGKSIIKKRYSEVLNQPNDHQPHPLHQLEESAKVLSRRGRQAIEDSLAAFSGNNSSDPVGDFARKDGEYQQLLSEPDENATARVNRTWASEASEPYEVAIVYNRTDIVLTNLKHFQMYSIEIVACHNATVSNKKNHKLCSSRAIASARTLPDPDADTINEKNITVENGTVTGTEIYKVDYKKWIHWADPPSPNGLIVLYDIEVVKAEYTNLKPEEYCIPHKMFRANRGFELQKLSPGNWKFRIRATSLAGNGSWTIANHFFIEEGRPLSTAIIVALAVIFTAVVIITLLIVYWLYKRRYEEQLKDSILVKLSTNPSYAAYNSYLSDIHLWVVPRKKVKLGGELGKGAFGMVYEGLLCDCVETQPNLKVAVKTVTPGMPDEDRIFFLKEISVMKEFDSPHIVRLLAVVAEGQATLAVMELMDNGDLKQYLRKLRPDEPENHDRKPPTLVEILQMASEIADGMAYLAHKKFVHRDLAARNCMVSATGIVKVGDFGLTRDLEDKDYYRKDTRGLLPVRWMAPESLKDGIYSSQSDVWSYGVVLWEMATLAALPYQGLANEEVCTYVGGHGVIEKPAGCPPKLHEMMQRCWNFSPRDRWSFEDILDYLKPDCSERFIARSYYYNIPPEDSQASIVEGQNGVIPSTPKPTSDYYDAEKSPLNETKSSYFRNYFFKGKDKASAENNSRVAHSRLAVAAERSLLLIERDITENLEVESSDSHWIGTNGSILTAVSRWINRNRRALFGKSTLSASQTLNSLNDPVSGINGSTLESNGPVSVPHITTLSSNRPGYGGTSGNTDSSYCGTRSKGDSYMPAAIVHKSAVHKPAYMGTVAYSRQCDDASVVTSLLHPSESLMESDIPTCSKSCLEPVVEVQTSAPHHTSPYHNTTDDAKVTFFNSNKYNTNLPNGIPPRNGLINGGSPLSGSHYVTKA